MDNLRKEFISKFRDPVLLKDTLNLINSVERNGEKEILKYYRAKGIKRKRLEVTSSEMKKALRGYKQEDLDTFKKLNETIKNMAKRERSLINKELVLNSNRNFESVVYNKPLETIGIYIPQNLPSSLIFYCQLAQTAGVKNILLALPPNEDGAINPHLLAAASLFKIEKILAIGGRNAYPALAFGLGGLIPDKLFGPCSLYVDNVKQLLNTFYKIPIDLPSGPSELLVFFDNINDLEQVEYDTRAQMEHGPDSRCFVVSDSKKLIDRLKERTIDIKSQVHFYLVKNSLETSTLINQIAPEILEIFTKKPLPIINRLKNIANVYINVCSPLGDYCVIGKGCADPTYGMANGVSGITLSSFYKTSCINIGLRKPKIKNKWFIKIPKIENFKYHKVAIEKFLSKG